MLRTSPGYDVAIAQSQNLVILPPVVEVNIVDVGRKAKRQYDYEYQLEEHIVQVLVEKLRSRGYNIKPVSRREIHDLKISRKVLTFQEEYQDHINKLYASLLLDEKKAFATDASFSSDLRDMKDSINADMLIFVEYVARNKTAAANSADFVISMASSFVPGASQRDPIEDAAEFVSIRVALIDVMNHKLLWANIARDGYSAMSGVFSSSLEKTDKKRLNQLFDELLKKLPAKK
jgi:hypothetical protein